ncbi:hypothetical protein [Aliikangiella maris]|uniref:Type II secretion system protein GspF domain-containing protein n=2 Tax=Aliikangiella maris TaxID=3162458 RepID=A0ABV2BW11_9GAMM
MNDHEMSFIRRHLKYLVQNDNLSVETFHQVLEIISDKAIKQKIKQDFKKSQSYIETLNNFGIINLDKKVVAIIKDKEKRQQVKNTHFFDVLSTHSIVENLLNRVKKKITASITYSIFLVLLAMLANKLITSRVLPKFQQFYVDANIPLPEITHYWFEWNKALISPSVLMLFYLFFATLLLFSINYLTMKQLMSSNSKRICFLQKIPYIRHLFFRIDFIFWLSHLREASKAQLKLTECLHLLPGNFNNVGLDREKLLYQLNISENVGQLTGEISYQIENFDSMSQKIIENYIYRLIAVIMLFISLLFSLIVISSYLPIFQLGDSI